MSSLSGDNNQITGNRHINHTVLYMFAVVFHLGVWVVNDVGVNDKLCQVYLNMVLLYWFVLLDVQVNIFQSCMDGAIAMKVHTVCMSCSLTHVDPNL